MTVYAKLQAHLQSGGTVTVRTYLRQTTYQPKHAGMFTEPKDARQAEEGVYVARGRQRDYVYAQYIFLT